MSFNPFNNAQETLGDVIGRSEESANRSAFSRDFNVSNFDSFGGELTAGKYVEIGRFTVPAETEYSWGYGRANNPENQGYLYVDLEATGSGSGNDGDAIEGNIRFMVESATGRKTEVVADFDTEKLDASKSDRGKQVPLPEQVGSSIATEDSHLVIEFDPVSANDGYDVDSSGDSEVIIPVTEYDLS
jgi:hypothetical protein